MTNTINPRNMLTAMTANKLNTWTTQGVAGLDQVIIDRVVKQLKSTLKMLERGTKLRSNHHLILALLIDEVEDASTRKALFSYIA